jgi:hypothetical protein
MAGSNYQFQWKESIQDSHLVTLLEVQFFLMEWGSLPLTDCKDQIKTYACVVGR